MAGDLVTVAIVVDRIVPPSNVGPVVEVLELVLPLVLDRARRAIVSLDAPGIVPDAAAASRVVLTERAAPARIVGRRRHVVTVDLADAAQRAAFCGFVPWTTEARVIGAGRRQVILSAAGASSSLWAVLERGAAEDLGAWLQRGRRGRLVDMDAWAAERDATRRADAAAGRRRR